MCTRGDLSLILWTVRSVLVSGMRLVGGLVLIALRLYLGSPLPGHGGQLEEELELVGGFVAWGHAKKDTLEGDPRGCVVDQGGRYLMVFEVMGSVCSEDIGQISA